MCLSKKRLETAFLNFLVLLLYKINLKRMFKMKNVLLLLALVMGSALGVSASVRGDKDALRFNPQAGVEKTLEMPGGAVVKFRAYERIYYVTNVEDSVYQYLNIYVPETVFASADQKTPILLRTYVGGYMASRAMGPSGTDATGRALQEGYVVCIPGSRGSNSTVERNGKTVYTGRVPAGLLDLKAAVRYLRHNDDVMPGDAERIITDGTSAGGAMSALLGSTGNSPVYKSYLKAMGAADERDDVYAAVCYCPITDLEHADMAYEWLYQVCNTQVRRLSEEQQKVSKELADAYPAYLNSLQLRKPDGTLLTDANYLDYVKSFLIKSAQRARSEGCELPDTIGIKFNEGGMPFMQAGGPRMRPEGRPGRRPEGRPDRMPAGGPQGGMMPKVQGEFVVDIDMSKYLNYVATTEALKTPPAFDAMGILGASSSPENRVFGNAEGSAVNFTPYGLRRASNDDKAEIASDLQKRVDMINPMNFIADKSSTKAKHWYIRHGARDRDTSFCVPVNLATKLMNNGYDVDFFLPWNRPHSGDYNLDDLFEWINGLK